MTYGDNGPWEEIPLYSLRFARLFIFKRIFGFDNSIYNPGPDIGSGLRFEPFIDLRMGSDVRLYRFFKFESHTRFDIYKGKQLFYFTSKPVIKFKNDVNLKADFGSWRDMLFVSQIKSHFLN